MIATSTIDQPRTYLCRRSEYLQETEDGNSQFAMSIRYTISCRKRPVSIYFVVIIVTAMMRLAGAAELTFQQISTNFSTFDSIDYFEPTHRIVTAAYYPNGNPYNLIRIAPDGSQSQYTSIAGLTSEIKVATARSPQLGGYGGSPFAAGTMFVPRSDQGVITKIAPDGTVTTSWSIMPNPATAGRFWGLHVDRTGVFGGDLIGATYSGNVFRINGAGAVTPLGSTGSVLQGLITVPNDPLVYGGMAGKILIGSEVNNRLYWFDAAGNSGYWSVPVAIDDLDLIVPNENFFGINYGGGRILGASAEQFQTQGLVGKILATQEFAALYALTWNFTTNLPQFEQITTAAGSPVSNHWEDVTFAPAGIAEIGTTLPSSERYRISGAFGSVSNLKPVQIPGTGIAITQYAYNGTTRTGNPPEARANKGVMTVLEDYRGYQSLMIVLDKSSDATGGSLQLQLTGQGSDLASTFINVQDDSSVNGDSYTYSAGTGLINWSWTAGQTDGLVIQLPYPRPISDPLQPWSITFSTLAMSGLEGFIFLANGQEIDLGSSGFNLTLGNPIAGDFNADGKVDAADYVVWRKTDRTQSGYNIWRSHFGQNAGVGSVVGASVPEPATLAVLLAMRFVILLWREDHCRHR